MKHLWRVLFAPESGEGGGGGERLTAEELTKAVLALDEDPVVDDPEPEEEEEPEPGDDPDDEEEELSAEEQEELEEELEEELDDDPDDDDEEEEEDDDPKERKDWTKKAQERFDELTRRAKEAEEKLAQLEAKLAEDPDAELGGAQAGAAASHLSGVPDAAQLDALETQARQLRAQLLRNPDGWEFKDKDGEYVEVTPEQVRDALVKVTDDLEQYIPMQRRYLQEEAQLSKAAVEFFPGLKDTGTELRQKADAVVRALPQVKSLPGWRFATGYYASGQMLAEVAGDKTEAVLQALREGKSVDKILAPKGAATRTAGTRQRKAPRAPGRGGPRRVSANRRGGTGRRLADAAASGDVEQEVETLKTFFQ